jgi:hypothetical protein
MLTKILVRRCSQRRCDACRECSEEALVRRYSAVVMLVRRCWTDVKYYQVGCMIQAVENTEMLKTKQNVILK